MANVALEQDCEWQAAHAALVELARDRAGLDFEEGRWLLSARRSEVHARLGFGSSSSTSSDCSATRRV
jgi:hypothetical protein